MLTAESDGKYPITSLNRDELAVLIWQKFVGKLDLYGRFDYFNRGCLRG